MFMFKWNWLLNLVTCYAADPADDGGDDDGGTAADPKVAALEKTVEDLTGIINTVVQGQTGLQSSLAQLAEAIKAGPNKLDDNDDDVIVPTSDELETMSRADLIDLINGGTKKMVDAALKPIMDKLGATDSKLDTAITNVTVKEFHKDHKDLMEWKVEIGDLIKSNRASTVEDAYTLARAQNPEKVKTVDAKYGPAPEKKPQFKGSFAGFPGKTSSGGTNKKMTQAEASAAAWDEATAGTPGIEEFLSNDNTN